MSITQRFADHVAPLAPRDVPAVLRDQMLLHALDTVAVAAAGASRPVPTAVRSAIAQPEAAAGVAAWGVAERFAPGDAALANGVAAHVLELDDTHGCDHSGAVVVPAVLATIASGDAAIADDDAFAAALAVGYEAARRMQSALGGYAALNDAGWHSTGICGPVGAAVACARIRGLDAEAMGSAIGLACSMAGGTWSFASGLGDNKALHAGLAARSGWQAAALAAAGVRGTRDALERTWGGLPTLMAPHAADPGAFVDDLGERWVAADAVVKRHPTCASSHPTIVAVERGLAEGRMPAPEAIERIEVRTSPIVADMCGVADLARMPTSAQRQLSIPYAIALLLVRGSVGLPDLWTVPDELPALRRLLDRIVVVPDAARTGALGDARIAIAVSEGSVVEVDAPALAHPSHPEDADAVVTKILDVTRDASLPELGAGLVDLYRGGTREDRPGALVALLDRTAAIDASRGTCRTTEGRQR